MTPLASLPELLCDALVSFLSPAERLALCATSKSIETCFARLAVECLTLGPRRPLSPNDPNYIHNLRAIARPPSYFISSLLSRVGPFVRRVNLVCTEESINDGILVVLTGAHRGMVRSIRMRLTGFPEQFYTRLVDPLRQKGLTRLEVLDVSFLYMSEHDCHCSSLAKEALRGCPKLTMLRVRGLSGGGALRKSLELLPSDEPPRRDIVGGKARSPQTLALRYPGSSLSGEVLRQILNARACASLVKLTVEAMLRPSDGVAQAVAEYLRATGAPFLRRLDLANNDSNQRGVACTEIARALRKGSAPFLESMYTNNMMMSANVMSILASAVVQNGRFWGLLKLNLVGSFDPSPLIQAIGTTHGCPFLQTLRLGTMHRYMVALREAFAAGASPAVTALAIASLQTREAEDVIPFLDTLGGRTTPMQNFSLGTNNHFPGLVYERLADVLLAPSFASLRVLHLHPMAFDPVLAVFGAGAGKFLEMVTFATWGKIRLSEAEVMRLHEALMHDGILPNLRSLGNVADGESNTPLQSFLLRHLVF